MGPIFITSSQWLYRNLGLKTDFVDHFEPKKSDGRVFQTTQIVNVPLFLEHSDEQKHNEFKGFEAVQRGLQIDEGTVFFNKTLGKVNPKCLGGGANLLI